MAVTLTAGITSSNYSATNQTLIASSTVGASATATGYLGGLDRFTSAELLLSVTAASGTLPTFNLYIQKLLADNATYTDLISFPQIITTGKSAVTVISQVAAPYTPATNTLAAGSVLAAHMGSIWQVQWVIGGSGSPSFTFALFGNFYE